MAFLTTQSSITFDGIIGVKSSYNKGSKFAFSIVLGLEKF